MLCNHCVGRRSAEDGCRALHTPDASQQGPKLLGRAHEDASAADGHRNTSPVSPPANPVHPASAPARSVCCPAARCTARSRWETRSDGHNTQRRHVCTSTALLGATPHANRLERSAKTVCASPARAPKALGRNQRGTATDPHSGQPRRLGNGEQTSYHRNQHTGTQPALTRVIAAALTADKRLPPSAGRGTPDTVP